MTHYDLQALNSATKYPSIPTYHVLGDKGRLTETHLVGFDGPSPLHVTEKIDGTNVRIIVCDDGDWFIGSREHLLAARGDRIGDPSNGIVAALGLPPEQDFAKLRRLSGGTPSLTVFYGELFGAKIGKAGPLYVPDGGTGFALFDVALIPVDKLDEDLKALAAWRDGGGQFFVEYLASYAQAAGPYSVVPELDAPPLPSSIDETYAWLQAVAGDRSRVGPTRPEGVVVRSRIGDRRIAKLRFEDYERTLRFAQDRERH